MLQPTCVLINTPNYFAGERTILHSCKIYAAIEITLSIKMFLLNKPAKRKAAFVKNYIASLVLKRMFNLFLEKTSIKLKVCYDLIELTSSLPIHYPAEYKTTGQIIGI